MTPIKKAERRGQLNKKIMTPKKIKLRKQEFYKIKQFYQDQMSKGQSWGLNKQSILFFRKCKHGSLSIFIESYRIPICPWYQSSRLIIFSKRIPNRET